MIWPIDDPTREPEPLTCSDCRAIGDAPCAAWCTYAEASSEAETMEDRDHDEAREDAAA